jgi:hypothetical protein
MNSDPSSSPRFACRIARFWQTVSPESPSGHIASCPDCRRYFAACGEVETALRREASGLEHDVPAGLERNIMHAITATPRVTARARIARTPFVVASTAAAAIAFVLGVVRWGTETGQPAMEFNSSREIAGLAAAAEAFSDEWLNSTLPTAGAAALNNPLRQELDSVYADARSALNFLALNFLPSNTTAATPKAAGSGGKG